MFGRIFGLQYLAFFCAFVVVKLVQKFRGCKPTRRACCRTSAWRPRSCWRWPTWPCCPNARCFCCRPRLFKLSHESLDERCRDIAAQYALTAREAEIFALLARGRDVGYIEKELFISRNTVNTHRKNLYRKLDIHTQQELLSLIEETLA